jgi:hypothetical protein
MLGNLILEMLRRPKKEIQQESRYTRAAPQRPDKAIARISIVIPHSVGHSWT